MFKGAQNCCSSLGRWKSVPCGGRTRFLSSMHTVMILGLALECFFFFCCDATTHSLRGSNVDDSGRFRWGTASDELGNKFFNFRTTLEEGDFSLLHVAFALAVSSITYSNWNSSIDTSSVLDIHVHGLHSKKNCRNSKNCSARDVRPPRLTRKRLFAV